MDGPLRKHLAQTWNARCTVGSDELSNNIKLLYNSTYSQRVHHQYSEYDTYFWRSQEVAERSNIFRAPKLFPDSINLNKFLNIDIWDYMFVIIL